MRAIVTRGSGFIGSHVVDKLIDAGHEVAVLDHRIRPHRDDVDFRDVDIVYVDDLADAHLLAIKKEAENQILNLEGMRRITVKEVGETIKKLVGDDVRIEYVPARPGDYKGKEVSNDKIKRLLGWEPKVDFEKGMKKTIEWFKEKYGIDENRLPIIWE